MDLKVPCQMVASMSKNANLPKRHCCGLSNDNNIPTMAGRWGLDIRTASPSNPARSCRSAIDHRCGDLLYNGHDVANVRTPAPKIKFRVLLAFFQVYGNLGDFRLQMPAICRVKAHCGSSNLTCSRPSPWNAWAGQILLALWPALSFPSTQSGITIAARMFSIRQNRAALAAAVSGASHLLLGAAHSNHQVLACFQCDVLDTERAFLMTDYSVECYTQVHHFFMVYGSDDRHLSHRHPGLLYVLLWRDRDVLKHGFGLRLLSSTAKTNEFL